MKLSLKFSFKNANIVLLLHDHYELTSNSDVPIHGILGVDFFLILIS